MTAIASESSNSHRERNKEIGRAASGGGSAFAPCTMVLASARERSFPDISPYGLSLEPIQIRNRCHRHTLRPPPCLANDNYFSCSCPRPRPGVGHAGIMAPKSCRRASVEGALPRQNRWFTDSFGGSRMARHRSPRKRMSFRHYIYVSEKG